MEVPLLDLPAPQRCKLGHCDGGGEELDTKTFREGKEGKGEGKPEWEKEKKEEEEERVGFCPARTGLGLLPSTTARMYTRTRRGEGGLPGTVRRSFAFLRGNLTATSKKNSGHEKEKNKTKNKRGNS